MPTDQDIREMCSRAIHALDVESFHRALAELRTALREHVVEAENKSLRLILKMSKVKELVKTGTED